MRNLDFWITLLVMVFIVVLISVIKCIPKCKLPYCLGGTKEVEKFTCPLEYENWCRKYGLPSTIPSNTVADMKKSDIIKKTLKMNGIPLTKMHKYKWD